jgi:16S rRNA (guanine1207-N2)-methyltransferase
MGVFKQRVKQIELEFETSSALFSPRGIDAGTLAMLDRVEFELGDRVLDLGCGYGAVGIVAARLIGAERVVMVDDDPEATRLARHNAELNGVPGVLTQLGDGLAATTQTGFTKILCNPPYHVDFAVPKRFIEKGFNRLELGGCMVIVTQRRKWYENKLRSIFGGSAVSSDGPYFILVAERRRREYAR